MSEHRACTNLRHRNVRVSSLQGEYQPEYGSNSCQKCLAGMTTLKRRSFQVQDCKHLCERNTVSRSGVRPCTACPPGYHQPLDGQKGCIPRNGMYVRLSGASTTTCSIARIIIHRKGIERGRNEGPHLAANLCRTNRNEAGEFRRPQPTSWRMNGRCLFQRCHKTPRISCHSTPASHRLAETAAAVRRWISISLAFVCLDIREASARNA